MQAGLHEHRSYLFEGLQKVASRHGQSDVYVVHDEEGLLLALVGETGQVVGDEQKHVDVHLLQVGGEMEERRDQNAKFTHTTLSL